MVMSLQQKRALLAEAKWLADNPQFEERPASIEQFLGPGYLDIASGIRPGIREALISIFGQDSGTDRMSRYERAMVTGGIGIGKTTFASIALPYMAHWVMCLKDPQDFFHLLPGTKIAFMQMSTSEQQAREVVFGDIFARIDRSKWFKDHPRDTRVTRQIKFPDKDVWILPGDSKETSFEGYNILGGVLDEMDSHGVTKDKDYADVGYDTIHSRIASRFIDRKTNGHKGLLICIGQMKKAEGFAARKKAEFEKDPNAHVTTMTIWESLGWDSFTDKKTGERDSFWYDAKRKEIIPPGAVEFLQTKEHLIEVPNKYRVDFENNPAKALRDLAGIPPQVLDAFITLADRVEAAQQAWIDKFGDESPVTDSPRRPQFKDWFVANGDPRKRVMHIDLALSGEGDALGMAMGHVNEMIIDESGERKPFIVIDFLLRMKGPSGGQIMLSDVRNIVYHVRDDLGFKLREVTMDGFQGQDTLQQLRKKRFIADYSSVDRSTLAYEDLRDAIYEYRIAWPPYVTHVNVADLTTENVLNRELLSLQDTGKKIDHPPKGSKDLADAVAGVVTRLMGDRGYHKGIASRRQTEHEEDSTTPSTSDAFTPVVRPAINPGPNGLDLVPKLTGFGGSSSDPFELFTPGVPRR